MLGLTTLGSIHTAIALVALVAGYWLLVGRGGISLQSGLGRLYVVTTFLTCITGFGIFQRGGFGDAHMLGIFTLVVLAVAVSAELWHSFGRASVYVATAGYTATLFFHMVPGLVETTTRFPRGAPLAAGPEDPGLQLAVGVVFLVFAAIIAFQLVRLRRQIRLSTQVI